MKDVLAHLTGRGLIGQSRRVVHSPSAINTKRRAQTASRSRTRWLRIHSQRADCVAKVIRRVDQ